MAIKNEIGSQFGRLTVTQARPSQNGKAAWLCSCTCGKVHTTTGDALRTGKVKSCGCYRDSGDYVRQHGHASYARGVSRTYSSWSAMRERCTRPSNISFVNYGARGIGYDPAWDSFEVFLNDMGERPADTSLDRKNGELGYSKSNCQWATRIEQSANRRNVNQITYLGKTQNLAAWCRELGVPYPRTYHRYIIRKQSFLEAVYPGTRPRRPRYQSRHNSIDL